MPSKSHSIPLVDAFKGGGAQPKILKAYRKAFKRLQDFKGLNLWANTGLATLEKMDFGPIFATSLATQENILLNSHSGQYNRHKNITDLTKELLAAGFVEHVDLDVRSLWNIALDITAVEAACMPNTIPSPAFSGILCLQGVLSVPVKVLQQPAT
ncbi:hypothetical protein B0H10DRAFT_1950313 [Mycena sp. CBHHK59/15]|nr:hypothetical protein B0H10DRAFT_1950313 [Mycena sp. CBHHK59/15]